MEGVGYGGCNETRQLQKSIGIMKIETVICCSFIMFKDVYNVIKQDIVSKILTSAHFFSPNTPPPHQAAPFKEIFWILRGIIYTLLIISRQFTFQKHACK